MRPERGRYFQLASTAAPHVFSPADIAGLQLWLKADGLLYSNDGKTIPSVNSGVVAVWDDASSAGNDAAQTNNGKRPIFTTGLQNGLPGVVFTGSQVMLCISLENQMQPYTLLVVFKGHGQYLFDGTPFDKGGLSIAGGNIRAINTVGNLTRPYTNDTVKLITSVMNDYASSLKVNLGAQATGTVNGDLVAPFQVGGLTLGAFAIEGAVFEICLYDNPLGSGDLDDVQQYLISKWGVT